MRSLNNKRIDPLCKECGYLNNAEDIFCQECGAELLAKTKQKRKQKKIVILFIAVLIVAIIAVGSLGGIKLYRISVSNHNFEMAQEYEKTNDYETAVNYYSLVIPDDTENYATSITKIDELNKKIKYIKNCAKCYVVASTHPYFNSNEVKSIFYAEDNSSYANMYGNGSVAIITRYMGTNCTFLIAPKKNFLLDESVYPVYYDATFKMYVYGIGTTNYTQGWLKSGYDTVTETYVDMAKRNCVEADINAVTKLVNAYYSKKDETIFE